MRCHARDLKLGAANQHLFDVWHLPNPAHDTLMLGSSTQAQNMLVAAQILRLRVDFFIKEQ